MNSKFSHRIVAIFVSVVMLFTMSPVLTFAGEYDAYEFVVSADKISVQSGDAVTLTVTVNGTMDNAYLLEFQIQYDPAEFNISPDIEEAFESTWYSEAVSGKGLGAIFQPSGGYKPDPAASSKNIYTVVYFDMMSPMFGRQPSFIGEDENDDLRGKDTAVAAKLVFTAQKDIEDISDCFIIKEAINGYGDKNGTIKDCEDTALVQLSETMAVQKVKNLIAAIGTPVTYSSKAAIEAARTAYNAITNESLKAQITADEVLALTAAEAALKERTDEMDRVKGLIAALDSTKDTFENDIKTAEAAFNALANDEKAALTDYAAKIQTAKDKLAQIKQEQADRAKAAEVDALIDLIGDVTLDSLSAIEAAENAWEALTPAQKGYVQNYEVLTQARQDYNTLSSYKKEAETLENSIKALSELGDIDRSNATIARSAINSVRASYDGVDEVIQNFVDDDVYQILLDAEAEIKLVEGAVQEAEAVEALINALGKITLKSKEKLDEIEDKLGKISEKAVSYIIPEKMAAYETACERYAELEEEEAKVQAVIGEIAALGDVDDIILEDKEAIESAEAAFAALGTVLQDRVTNAQTLRDIRTRLNVLIKSEADVNNVIKLIGEIGEVTLNSSAKINAARDAYDALTEDERARVGNYTVLTNAEELFKELLAAAEQEKIDQTAADGVEELIAAIGTVELTDECEALIKAAESAYARLTDHQKDIVENYGVLTQARSEYDALNADKEAVDAVIKAIDDIGTVEYSNECLAKIEAAKEAFGLLREDLQGRVTNADKIAFSEERYAQLKADTEAVDNVIDLIAAIGDVSWTEDSLDKITKARNAYEELKSLDLKERVTNIKVLEMAEETYNSLKPNIGSHSVQEYNSKYMTVVTNVSGDMIVSDGVEDAVVVKIGEDIYHVFVTDHEVFDIVLRHGAPEVHELGDVNGDDMVTATDALVACKYAAGYSEAISIFENPMAFVRADVNGDGKLNVVDALMIATKLIDDEVKFTILTSLLGIE